MGYAAQGEHDLGGVVDVGVVVVGELERPAARLELGPAHRPVARHQDLLAQQPVGGRDERGIVGRHAGVGQRDRRQRRVPHRRLAGLDPASPVVDGEAVEPVEAGAHHGMLERIAAQMQGDQRVDPGRLDPAPAAVGLLAPTIHRSARAIASSRNARGATRW